MLADNDILVLALADNPSHSDLLMSLWVDTWTVWGLCRCSTYYGGRIWCGRGLALYIAGLQIDILPYMVKNKIVQLFVCGALYIAGLQQQ